MGEGDRQLEHHTEGSLRPQSALPALSSPEEWNCGSLVKCTTLRVCFSGGFLITTGLSFSASLITNSLWLAVSAVELLHLPLL